MTTRLMQSKCRKESRLLLHARRAAGLAFTLLALQSAGDATPAMAAAAKSSAATVEKWEGYWAKTRKECRYSDGPDSKTMIDLKNSENGKPAPLYDQYENHCRIDGHATKGNATTLKLICFEFWDDTANQIGQNECRKKAQFRGDKDADNGDNQQRLCRGDQVLKIVSKNRR